jgi:hypothetical protein
LEILEAPGDADGALGRDLSLDGVRLTGGPLLKPGMKVTLALYAGHESEPVALEAEVIRASAEDTALVFERMTEIQRQRLAELITQRPALDALSAWDPAGGRLVAARVLEQQD